MPLLTDGSIATTADAAENGNHLKTSGRNAPAMPSKKNTPIPTPMPASWLRAIVAIANPSAASIDSASVARPNSSGSEPERVPVAHAARGDVEERAPNAASTTPTRNDARNPANTMMAIATNPSTVYRVRLSPRATAALSVPHVHSEPAIAAPYVTASRPPIPRTSPTVDRVRAREGHDRAGREGRLRILRLLRARDQREVDETEQDEQEDERDPGRRPADELAEVRAGQPHDDHPVVSGSAPGSVAQSTAAIATPPGFPPGSPSAESSGDP